MTINFNPTILQILNQPNKPGGIQSVATVLAETLEAKGLVCHKSRINLTSILKDIMFYRKSLPTIVIVHGMSNLVTLRALLYLLLRRVARCRPVRTIWQVHFHPFSHHHRPLLAKLYFYSVNLALASIADTVVAITPIEKQYLAKHITSSKIRVVPNPLRSFSEDLDVENVSKYIEGENTSRPYVLTVGRNDYNKNIAAVSALTTAIKGAGYDSIIVTNSKDHIDANCTVYLDCSDTELNMLIANAYCVVIPAKYEAFSLVAIESIARGTPLICGSNVGALSFGCVRRAAVITDFTESSFLSSLRKVNLPLGVMNTLAIEVNSTFSTTTFGDNWLRLIRHV